MQRNCTIQVAKTKALISVFVFAYANSWFSHEAVQIKEKTQWNGQKTGGQPVKRRLASMGIHLACKSPEHSSRIHTTKRLTVYHLCMYEAHHEKTNNVVSEQVRHKPSCTVTEDS